MPLEFKPGTSIRVTVSKAISRASALKTLERLFMKDRAIARPIEIRSREFQAVAQAAWRTDLDEAAE